MGTRSAALAAASLLVAGLAGCSNGEEGGGPEGSPSSAVTEPSDAVRTMAAWDEEDDGDAEIPVEPGEYLMPASGWSLADFTVTFPADWTVQYGHVFATRTETGGELGFYSVVIDHIFTDACSPADESKRSVGPALDDLYRALRHQRNGAVLSEPVSTTFGGRSATRFDMRVPDDLDLATCRMGPSGLQIWYSAPADKYLVLLAGGTVSVYVAEVDGERQVFVVQVDDSASPGDRAELQTVLDSVRIEPLPPDGTARPEALADDGSTYFAADQRRGAAPRTR